MVLDYSAYTGEFSPESQDFLLCCREVLDLYTSSENIIRAARNTLKVIIYEGEECVIKAFKIPTFPQNISYGLIADSKAKKSYYNGHKLLELGFDTPRPVGYFERRKAGKLLDSYYLCSYEEAKTLKSYLEGLDEVPDMLIAAFASYCVELHQKGVLHRDFNPLNILVTEESGIYHFSLVDINRISWGETLSLVNAMKSMSRLYFPKGIEARVLAEYARTRGADLSECQRLLKKEQQKTKQYFANKKKLRKIFPKK